MGFRRLEFISFPNVPDPPGWGRLQESQEKVGPL